MGILFLIYFETLKEISNVLIEILIMKIKL